MCVFSSRMRPCGWLPRDSPGRRLQSSVALGETELTATAKLPNMQRLAGYIRLPNPKETGGAG